MAWPGIMLNYVIFEQFTFQCTFSVKLCQIWPDLEEDKRSVHQTKMYLSEPLYQSDHDTSLPNVPYRRHVDMWTDDG